MAQDGEQPDSKSSADKLPARGRPTGSKARYDSDAPPSFYAPVEPENYAGIAGQPPVVSHSTTVKTFAPKKLSHRLKYIIQLAAMGCTRTEIAERSGYSTARLSTVFNSPLISNEVERTRHFIFERDAERALKTMVPKALRAIDDVLSVETTNFKEQISKSDVAFSLLERTHGKAKQQIEMGGNLLADLLAMMDSRDAKASEQILEAERAEREQGASDAEYTEARPASPASPAPPDDFDTFLDSNLSKENVK